MQPSAKRARVEDADNGPVVAYPGVEGSLAHLAAQEFFKYTPSTRFSGAKSYENTFDAVMKGEAVYGVLPIENSTSGTIQMTYDLLLQKEVLIGAEIVVNERYCLCGKPKVQLASVSRIMSHPAILAACSIFIETRLPRSQEARFDTVATRSESDALHRLMEASEEVSESCAVITSRDQGLRHGLVVLSEDIGNFKCTESRYITIRRETTLPPTLPFDRVDAVQKRSGYFAVRNEPQALFKLLSCWAFRGIDVVKVQTYPMSHGYRAPAGFPVKTTRLWDYLFYVDYVVPPDQTEAQAAQLASALNEFSVWHRDFGCYYAKVSNGQIERQSWGDFIDTCLHS